VAAGASVVVLACVLHARKGEGAAGGTAAAATAAAKASNRCSGILAAGWSDGTVGAWRLKLGGSSDGGDADSARLLWLRPRCHSGPVLALSLCLPPPRPPHPLWQKAEAAAAGGSGGGGGGGAGLTFTLV
jgi:hypothetical protein